MRDRFPEFMTSLAQKKYTQSQCSKFLSVLNFEHACLSEHYGRHSHSVSLTKQQNIIPASSPSYVWRSAWANIILPSDFRFPIRNSGSISEAHAHHNLIVIYKPLGLSTEPVAQAKKDKGRWPAARARQKCRCWRRSLRCILMAAPAAPWTGGRRRTQESRTSSCSICGSSTLSPVRALPTLHYIQCLIFFTLARPYSSSIYLSPTSNHPPF